MTQKWQLRCRVTLLFTQGNSFPSITTYNQQSSQQSSHSPAASAKMAILPGVPFIRVTVNAPKISAEYPDLDDNEDDNTQNGPQHKMSVYIESKTGAKFGLQYLVDPAKIPKLKKKKNYCLGFFAVVDGKKTR